MKSYLYKYFLIIVLHVLGLIYQFLYFIIILLVPEPLACSAWHVSTNNYPIPYQNSPAYYIPNTPP